VAVTVGPTRSSPRYSVRRCWGPFEVDAFQESGGSGSCGAGGAVVKMKKERCAFDWCDLKSPNDAVL
jgi:hypothetical protein